MINKIKILAVCGSTRKTSSNLSLIKAITDLTSEVFHITIFEKLSELPHFNPDLDNEKGLEEVANFRRQLREADGVLICTPEYAVGVPGTLKNAIDWTVSTMEFSKKPVALITASLSGEKAHESLLGTLLILEAQITSESNFVISFVQTKVDRSGTITDQETLQKVKNLVQSLTQVINKDLTHLLSAPILMNDAR